MKGYTNVLFFYEEKMFLPKVWQLFACGEIFSTIRWNFREKIIFFFCRKMLLSALTSCCDGQGTKKSLFSTALAEGGSEVHTLSTSLCCNTLHYTALPYTLHCRTLQCTAPHFTTLICTATHWTALHCSDLALLCRVFQPLMPVISNFLSLPTHSLYIKASQSFSLLQICLWEGFK